MKKVLSFALATAMIASMAATALAVNYSDFKVPGGVGSKADGFTVDEKNSYYPVVNAIGPLNYDNDDKALMPGNIVEYGETAHYALIENISDDPDVKGTLSLVSKSDSVSSLKIKAKWEEGSNLVKSVSIVKKKVQNGVTDSGTINNSKTTYDSIVDLLGDDYKYEKDGYYYFLAIATESSTTTSDSDIIGTLTLNKSKAPKIDDLVLDISLNIDWAQSYRIDSEFEVDGDISDLKAETYYALKFTADEEIELGFSDDSIFTVDVSGQSKLLIYYDTKFNSKIAAKYPLAELNFWNGNGAKFNRVGEMFIPVKEDYAQFLYQLNADGTLSEVPGAEYDKYDEGFYFYTRVLGTYVISDMELDLTPSVTTPSPDPAPVAPPPAVTNPSTGAAA